MNVITRIPKLLWRTFWVFSPFFFAFGIGTILKPALGSLIFLILGIPCGPLSLMVVSHFQDKDQIGRIR